jgi:ATP synthase protein I
MAANDPEQAPAEGGDSRLGSLDERLKAAQRAEAERTAPVEIGSAYLSGKGMSQGNRVLSTLIGVPFGGLVVGFAIDEVAGTRPGAMLVMLFLGIVAAFVQIWRISKERAE